MILSVHAGSLTLILKDLKLIILVFFPGNYPVAQQQQYQTPDRGTLDPEWDHMGLDRGHPGPGPDYMGSDRGRGIGPIHTVKEEPDMPDADIIVSIRQSLQSVLQETFETLFY